MNSHPLASPKNPQARRLWLHRVGVAALFFIVIAPSLKWLEFAGGMENFNVETAMEIVRDHCWLIPTMASQPRIEKPPLVEWITAWGIMAGGPLGWAARWPSLIGASLILAAAYELGRTLDDWPLGLITAAVCGTNLLFLKFARQASYDVHLALWVTVCNVFIARVMFKNGRWVDCLAAGVALGLALLSKGPPAILQTVWPVIVAVVGWKLIHGRGGANKDGREIEAREMDPANRKVLEGISATAVGGGRVLTSATAVASASDTSVTAASDVKTPSAPASDRSNEPGDFDRTDLNPSRDLRMPILVATLVALALSLPWPLYVLYEMRSSLATWWKEITLHDEQFEHKLGWHTYFILTPMMTPWFIWFVTGLIEIARTAPRRLPKLWMAVLWMVAPVAVMIFFAARRDRYLLPMVPAASIIAALGVMRHVPRWGQWNTLQRWLLGIHWLTLFGMAVLLPLAGTISAYLPIPTHWKLLTNDGAAWYSPALGAGIAALAAAMLVGFTLLYRRWWPGFVVGTVCLALVAHFALMWGYKNSEAGLGEGPAAANEILSRYPDAIIYNARPDLRRVLPQVFMIYLNRDVLPLGKAQQLPDTTKPVVLIYPPDRNDEVSHDALPPGFSDFSRVKLNTGIYRMAVRP